ncbi:MAG: Arc family DNA-binding protein [Acidobacteriota bacterium]
MASFTLKNLPPELLERLRERAADERRSVNQQAIHMLEQALERPDPILEARIQADAWHRLAGLWLDERPVREEIAAIYAARSGGRPLDVGTDEWTYVEPPADSGASGGSSPEGADASEPSDG